jgi:hypothetical protein
MTDFEYGITPELDEPDARFETIAKLRYPNNPDVHHTRISVKDKGDHAAIAVKSFADPSTPHRSSDDCIHASEGERAATAIQTAVRQIEGDD